MTYKELLEEATRKESFNIKKCVAIENYITDNSIIKKLQVLKDKLRVNKTYSDFKQALIRFSFFIELTDPSAESDSTKYQVRWTNSLHNDPRFAVYEDCIKIFEKLLISIISLDNQGLSILTKYCENSIYKVELPIDYIECLPENIHTVQNVALFINSDIEKCTLLRSLLKDETINSKSQIFNKIISNKIKVKAYQTDRAQTGVHKTNREKRWEAHPLNFQFAFHRDCNLIESELLLQVCTFKGLNEGLVGILKNQNLLPSIFENYKCPVTGEFLYYTDFEQEILNQTHGKSMFQVGHLTPLKNGGRHVPDNIGWISDDGNRIQGSLSLEEVDNLLIKIYKNRMDLRSKLEEII